MKKITIVTIATLALASCGENGSQVFPNGQAAWEGLADLKFGESCDSLADRLSKSGLVYIMSDGTDSAKNRSDGDAISLKSQSYMGVPASAVIDCKDGDGVSGFRIIGEEQQRDVGKFAEFIPQLVRSWQPPSRETTDSARNNDGYQADLPNVYWDNISGTNIHARLNFDPIAPKVRIYVSFKPAQEK